jgi:hypothetical protein
MHLGTVPLVRLTSWLGQEIPLAVWVNPSHVLWVEPLTRSATASVTGTRLVFGPEATLDVRELPYMVIGRLQGHLGDAGSEYIEALAKRQDGDG